MGLLKILRKIKLKEKQIRLLILGLDNSGKTTIVKSILNENVNEISPTLGFTINTLKHDDYLINLWDIGGQTTIRSYWRNYFEQTDGVIWVVDSSDKLRMKDCKEELHSLLKQDKLAGSTLLIFCNKQDIEGALSMEQIKDVLELEEIKTRHWMILPCSAISKECVDIEKGLKWIIEDVNSRIFMLQ
jgi:ADP-ribosylation factor-like protein 2